MIRRSSTIARTALVAVALSVLAVACGGSSGDSARTVIAAPPEIAPAASASFGVGFKQLTVKDTAGTRDLAVDVWYPATKGATGTPARYALLPTAYIDSKVAIADAPLAAGGALPLIVYAHGSGGQNFVASFLTEQLASQGFIVVAANHIGDTALDRFTNTTVVPDQNDLNRPADVTREIDDMLARSKSSGDFFSGRVDSSRIGLVGHSYGGYTVIADVAGHTTSLGSVKPDSRIKAVVAQAPYTLRLTPAELAADKVPTMLISGSKDTTTPTSTNAAIAFENITGPPVVLVEIAGAAHQSFTDVCAYLDQIPKLPEAPAPVIAVIQTQAKEGCGAEFIDYARGLLLTNDLTVAFLQKYVAGKADYEAYWGDWAAQQPELTVKVKG